MSANSLKQELLDLQNGSLREAYHLVKDLTIHKAKARFINATNEFM